jgi:hypothetical protein
MTLASRTTNAAPISSTVQGGGKRRVSLAIIVYSWPPLVDLAGHPPMDQCSFSRPDAP